MRQLILLILLFLCSIKTAIPLTLGADLIEYKKLLENKLHDLAFVVWCEDSSNDYGMSLVSSVIINRGNNSRNITDLHKIVTKKSQFECWTRRDEIMSKMKERDIEKYKLALNVISDYVYHKKEVITKATHFLNPTVYGKKPKWTRVLKRLETYNGNIYYR